MTLPEWLSVAALCGLGAMSPGPSLAVVLHHSLGPSRLGGVVCALSHAAGVGLYALGTAIGLAALLARQPGLYRLLAVAGAAYLAWLGLRLLRAGPAPAAARPHAPGLAAAARDGFVTALLNPKIALFFLALFSQFVGPDPGAVTVALLTATATVIDGAWYAAVALLLAGSPRVAGLQRHGARLDRVLGAALLALAAWVLLDAW